MDGLSMAEDRVSILRILDVLKPYCLLLVLLLC